MRKISQIKLVFLTAWSPSLTFIHPCFHPSSIFILLVYWFFHSRIKEKNKMQDRNKIKAQERHLHWSWYPWTILLVLILIICIPFFFFFDVDAQFISIVSYTLQLQFMSNISTLDFYFVCFLDFKETIFFRF